MLDYGLTTLGFNRCFIKEHLLLLLLLLKLSSCSARNSQPHPPLIFDGQCYKEVWIPQPAHFFRFEDVLITQLETTRF